MCVKHIFVPTTIPLHLLQVFIEVKSFRRFLSMYFFHLKNNGWQPLLKLSSNPLVLHLSSWDKYSHENLSGCGWKFCHRYSSSPSSLSPLSLSSFSHKIFYPTKESSQEHLHSRQFHLLACHKRGRRWRKRRERVLVNDRKWWRRRKSITFVYGTDSLGRNVEERDGEKEMEEKRGEKRWEKMKRKVRNPDNEFEKLLLPVGNVCFLYHSSFSSILLVSL